MIRFDKLFLEDNNELSTLISKLAWGKACKPFKHFCKITLVGGRQTAITYLFLIKSDLFAV